MINIESPILTTFLICVKAVEPAGGRHGTYIDIDRKHIVLNQLLREPIDFIIGRSKSIFGIRSEP